MLLDLMNGHSLYVRHRDEPVYINLRTPAMPKLPAHMRNSIYRFNELSVLWTSLNLARENRRILISVAQEPEKTMGWFKDALELDGWQEIASFKPPDDEARLRHFNETLAVCIDYCGADSYEAALLIRGIATNHGQMPQRLRRLMINLVDRGVCPITVATATLTEGVNLPFDLIFVTALKRRFFEHGTGITIKPISTSEFNNLAGRAGRPGATKGMEGLTLVAIPQRPSTTAPRMMLNQRRQIRALKNEYRDLIDKLLEAELEEEVNSPLALLLHSIEERARELLGMEGDHFLNWLEAAIPAEISDHAGTAAVSARARLADSVDELDNVLLSALEELRRIENRDIQGGDAEVFLSGLWQSTFTHVAAVQEAWLEQAFVRRGRAIIEHIYPDSDERERLYQYGFPPFVGRRFEAVAPEIRAGIEAAREYGTASKEERLSIFESLGDILAYDRGFGFRIRGTETDRILLENWHDVLAWWMQGDGAEGPEPSELRAWQRFVADNLEFRLGVAASAVVAQAWSDGINDPQDIPSIETWRENTGLPWFGFWIRELLRWGTLDPLIAFSLAQGLASTRNEATELRANFDAWLIDRGGELEADDMIDPQLFMEWQRSNAHRVAEERADDQIEAEITGTNGRQRHYNVIPIKTGRAVKWIDASGYELARSQVRARQIGLKTFKNDYELRIAKGAAVVQRTFAAH